MKNFKRHLVVMFLSLFTVMAFSAVSHAATAPAEVQYEYDPITKASDDEDAVASASTTSDDGESSQFPLLLIAAIVLILLAFGVKAATDRRRRGESGAWVPRPTVPLALMGAILIGALAFGAGGTTAAPSPKAPPGFLNIAPQEGTSEADTARMAAGGIKVIRVPVAWSIVQSENAETFDWGLYDSAFRTAAVNGLRILPTLYSTPPWLAKKTTTLPKTASQISSWRKFVAAAVQRYGSKGKFWDEPAQEGVSKTPPKEWQLWNEVNFHYFAFPVSAKDYGKVVNSASPVVKANDPKAKVMLSGLFARPKGPKKKAIHATVFIKQLSRYVKGNKLDSIALHPYTPDTKELEMVVRDFRKAVNKTSYRGKSMAITEIGWGSAKKTNAFLSGSESKQATQLTSALGWLIKNRRKYKIEGAYWYTWKDSDPKGVNCSFCYSSGLFKFVKPVEGKETPLKAKKAWAAFVKLTGGQAG